MNRTNKNIITGITLAALIAGNVATVIYAKDNQPAEVSTSTFGGRVFDRNLEDAISRPVFSDTDNTDSATDGNNVKQFNRGDRTDKQKTKDTSTSTDTTKDTSKDSSETPSEDLPMQPMDGEPPEMPSGEMPDGEMPSDIAPPSESAETASTNTVDQKAASTKRVATEVASGILSTLAALVAMYLILSNFNKKSIGETFEGSNALIYLVASLIIIIALLAVDTFAIVA